MSTHISIPSADEWPPSGASTPAYGSYTGSPEMGLNPLDINLDSDSLVIRGQGGDMNPAYLSGNIELNLSESTNIKEIAMSLQGKAKVHLDTSKAYTHLVLDHDWSFLQGDKRHTHTLKAGHHSFPFSLVLNGQLPSSIHTTDATISYKLRANVVRSGLSSNFHAVKTFTLHRTYNPEALEFNQTLEIENTWPGKVMYALTLPFKAYAAGDDIPVNVKFMPLAKGVKVLNITSVIKEYSLVHTKHASYDDQRVAASVKHELRNGRAVQIAEEPIRPPPHWQGGSRHDTASWAPRPADSFFPTQPEPSSSGRDRSDSASASGLQVGDDEVNTQFTIPLPPWTTPSHSIHPVYITHKVKWSCSISNADGHISELRCALPIIVLDHSLLEEARTAGASTRNLLFGGTSETQQIDLPSYSNHVYDRVAIADSGSSSVQRSVHSTPLTSPHSGTPPHISRPSSPTLDDNDVPPRPELSSWADSELLLSLGALRAHSDSSSPRDTPSASRGPSRPLSRRGSRSGRSSNIGSRGGSRASSPERPPSEHRHGFFHLPSSFKPMRPLTGASKPILRPTSDLQRHSVSFGNLPNATSSGRVSFAADPTRPEVEDDETEDRTEPINRVPSYAIASRGFLGGGVVPLHVGPPTYDDSERSSTLVRPRSDTALMDMGAEAAAAAEERA